MPKKYSFPELGCSRCEHLQRIGGVLCETRYCGGFPKKKKPRRFRSSDPKYKAPKWRPRRLPTPVCRIYGFADEQSRSMDILAREGFDSKKDQYISIQASHYKLRLEMPFSMNARTFFEATRHGGSYEILSEHDIGLGEVVEIDDGLKPYYFYYLNWSKVVPVSYFNLNGIQKGN